MCIRDSDIGETCLAANADGELYRWGNMAAGKSLKNNITVSPVEVDYPYACLLYTSITNNL